MQYIEQLTSHQEFGDVCLIASDIDGTLTVDEMLSMDAMHTIEQLKEYDVSVLLVTGRSAGWGHALAGYLPVVGVIAENGGVFIRGGALEPPQDITGIGDWQQHRNRLAKCFYTLKNDYPQLDETGDNFSRLSDWTFEVQGLAQPQLDDLQERCHREGFAFTYSSVHCHIMSKSQEKGAAIEYVTGLLDPALSLDKVMTIGDSLNDVSMFDPTRFPLSVGVRNIEQYLELMEHNPKYLSLYQEAKGFVSTAGYIVKEKTLLK